MKVQNSVVLKLYLQLLKLWQNFKKNLRNKQNTYNILRCDICSATAKLYLSKLKSGPTKVQNLK